MQYASKRFLLVRLFVLKLRNTRLVHPWPVVKQGQDQGRARQYCGYSCPSERKAGSAGGFPSCLDAGGGGKQEQALKSVYS